MHGDQNYTESESNAKEPSNIWMCIQLTGHYLTFSIKDSVGDSIWNFVGLFHSDVQLTFCNLHLHSSGLQMCTHFNPNDVYTSDMYSSCVEQSAGILDEIFLPLNVKVISLGHTLTDCATHNKCTFEVHDTTRTKTCTHLYAANYSMKFSME